MIVNTSLLDTATCSVCKQNKQLDEFHKNNRKVNGRASQCKRCRSLEEKLRTYNITAEQYFGMAVLQDYKCKICGIDDRDTHKGLHVDHCHNSGEVRGLLCLPCNTQLGIYEKRKQDFERYLNGR